MRILITLLCLFILFPQKSFAVVKLNEEQASDLKYFDFAGIGMNMNAMSIRNYFARLGYGITENAFGYQISWRSIPRAEVMFASTGDVASVPKFIKLSSKKLENKAERHSSVPRTCDVAAKALRAFCPDSELNECSKRGHMIQVRFSTEKPDIDGDVYLLDVLANYKTGACTVQITRREIR